MPDAHETYTTLTRRLGDGEHTVLFRKAGSPQDLPHIFRPLKPSVSEENGIVAERDVAVVMRDGATIYTDVLRPAGADNAPAVIAWSSPGKSYTFHSRGGTGGLVPEGALSPLAKQEGPDPAYWCHYGYAVINPDPRGVGNSDGDIQFLSETEYDDIYDLIEWTAQQPWSNGKVAMHGTAFSGVTAWFAAAKRPPHLACIAPWEAFSDLYRDVLVRGGVVDSQMFGHVLSRLRGNGGLEDVVAMAEEHPLMNGYWEEKAARIENIDIPVYVTANVNLFHQAGLRAFEELTTPHKWLRIHNSISWRDLYLPDNLEDLRRFFDRYLKGIHNGWEFTPPVRLSLYDSAGDTVNRPEPEWPPARTEHRAFYLDASDGSLSPTPVGQESAIRYAADGTGEASFVLPFENVGETVGYGKLRLWVEAVGADDMDLFVTLQRLDADGRPLPIPFYGQPHGGVSGVLRVSHRELDGAKSTDSRPVPAHRRQLPLEPGQITAVDIPLWPFGYVWNPGEQLRVTVSDRPRRAGSGADLLPDTRWNLANKGEHIIHTGGKYDSLLLLPVLPARSGPN
ncbi:CocE/NonD family hydrolase [Streptomyces sp. NPDC093085]|uniref:CocE/NonD family hydrolase n=1 Tax=Streptomyces sp. NPDC093085 TaxID=3155068 RepID=UPI0034245995